MMLKEKKSMAFKVIVVLLCVACLGLAGCRGASEGDGAKPGSEESEVSPEGEGQDDVTEIVNPFLEVSGIGDLKDMLGIELAESDMFKGAMFHVIDGYMGQINMILKDSAGTEERFTFRCVKEAEYKERVKAEEAADTGSQDGVPAVAVGADGSNGSEEDEQLAYLQMLHGVYDEDMSVATIDESIGLIKIKALTDGMNMYCWKSGDELFCLTCRAGWNEKKELDTLVAMIDASKVDGEKRAREPFASMPGEFALEKESTEWKTVISLSEDGSFLGDFESFDPANADPANYPNGTMYVCGFAGRFGDVKTVSEAVYETSVARLLQEGEEGEETGEEGMRIVTAYPCGLENGEHMLIYAPGTKTADLPDGLLLWLYEYLSREEARALEVSDFEGGAEVGAGEARDGSKLDTSKIKEELPETLPCWALYNRDMDEAFFGE